MSLPVFEAGVPEAPSFVKAGAANGTPCANFIGQPMRALLIALVGPLSTICSLLG